MMNIKRLTSPLQLSWRPEGCDTEMKSHRGSHLLAESFGVASTVSNSRQVTQRGDGVRGLVTQGVWLEWLRFVS